MPIRLLKRKGMPYAYMWGWHGHAYLISKFGVEGSKERAAAQARAAYAAGYRGR